MITLESDARDMRVRLETGGLVVTLLGHDWQLSWLRASHDPVLISIDLAATKLEGHDLGAKTPAECPGCVEFVKEN